MLPEKRQHSLEINFIYELDTCYPKNGKEFSDFQDCLVFLKVLLNILTKLVRWIFSHEYVLEIYESVDVSFFVKF